MLVTVIGGAGRVGAMITPRLSEEHQVRVADRRPVVDDPESVTVDVTDHVSLGRAVANQDGLVYAAMGRRDGWGSTGGWAESHFDVNVKGLYLTLSEAARAGVRRVVYASSLSIFDDYLGRGRELERIAPDAQDAYGLSKRLGEQVCEAAARAYGLTVIALRLCGPLPDDEWRNFGGRCPEVMTAASDVAEAFAAALRYDPPTGFEAFVVCGDRDQRYIAQSRTYEDLGWRPTMRRQGAPAVRASGDDRNR